MRGLIPLPAGLLWFNFRVAENNRKCCGRYIRICSLHHSACLQFYNLITLLPGYAASLSRQRKDFQ